jgi:hypothetical protein
LMLECKHNRKADTLRPTDIPDLRLDLFSHYSPQILSLSKCNRLNGFAC